MTLTIICYLKNVSFLLYKTEIFCFKIYFMTFRSEIHPSLPAKGHLTFHTKRSAGERWCESRFAWKLCALKQGGRWSGCRFVCKSCASKQRGGGSENRFAWKVVKYTLKKISVLYRKETSFFKLFLLITF